MKFLDQHSIFLFILIIANFIGNSLLYLQKPVNIEIKIFLDICLYINFLCLYSIECATKNFKEFEKEQKLEKLKDLLLINDLVIL